MSFDELRALLVVVDEGSFLSAAVRLGVSRTTLRRPVDALEARAGVPLLHRNRTGVVLTEAGRLLTEAGRVMQHDFDALLRSIRDTGGRPTGRVRVVVPVGLPPMPIAMLYALIQSNWPEVQVHARSLDSPLSANLSEVDVVAWFGDGRPAGAWEVHTATVIRQRLVASRAYLDARGTPTSLDALASHAVLAWVTPDDLEPALTTLGGARMPLNAAVASTDAHFLHECAQLGRGIAWVPDGAVPDGLGREPLVPVLEDLVGRDVPFQVAVPRLLADVPKVRLFITHLESMRSAVLGVASAAR